VAEYLNGGSWQLTAEFTEVESGKRNDRPELEKALAACRRTGATLVIAKLDRLSRRSWTLIQARTARLTCQGALSQISASTRTPSAASWPATQARKARVTALTGRPATNRSKVRPGSGSHRP
jgi:Resolvase, N terminal domain